MRPNTFLDELLVISLVHTIIMIKDKKLSWTELEAEMIMLVSDDGDEDDDENDGQPDV